MALYSEFLLELELLKNYKDSNCHKNSLCNASSLDFGHFHFFDMLFHFWHVFCTTTVVDDWQGHVTMSCKEPIAEFAFHMQPQSKVTLFMSLEC